MTWLKIDNRTRTTSASAFLSALSHRKINNSVAAETLAASTHLSDKRETGARLLRAVAKNEVKAVVSAYAY